MAELTCRDERENENEKTFLLSYLLTFLIQATQTNQSNEMKYCVIINLIFKIVRRFSFLLKRICLKAKTKRKANSFNIDAC